MSRLRDAIFVVNEDDAKALKGGLKAQWFRRRRRRFPDCNEAELQAAVDRDVENRFIENYSWFAHKARRLVPEPRVLEGRLPDVVDTYANVPNGKTEAELFTPKTWIVFKETTGHIRKGCLSDRPDLDCYYITGVMKDGFPIYKCTRGTSALEGYHRHLRALVAQGRISPRLLIASLRSFNYRWNVERSVDNEDLPSFYSGWYSHWNVESSQGATINWYDGPVHPVWISTKEFVSSGEQFYLISNERDGDAIDGSESDADDLENTLEHRTWAAMLPPSLQWLARQEGAKIPTARFASPQEQGLF